MSFNGNGVFLINTPGQPVVSGTTITSTAFNALTTDLASGLTNTITKDGQTNITANIPMSNFKITGLGAGTNPNDAVRLAQIQDGIINGRFVNLEYTGTFTGGTGVVAIGTNQIYKNASGNVGFGTNLPSQKLDINNGRIALTESYDIRWIDASTAIRGSITADSGSNLLFGTGASNLEKMRISAVGDVGIGTLSPLAKLHVDGGSILLGAGGGEGGEIAFRNAANNATAAFIDVNGSNEFRIYNSLNTPTIFYTNSAEALRINADGKVGIGGVPSNALDVFAATGTITASSTTGTNFSKFQVNNTGGSFQIAIDNSTGSNYGSAAAYARCVWNDSTTAPTLFYTNFAERMRIDASGNVSIKVTSAIGRFNVQSDDAATAIAAGNASGTAAYNGALFYNNGFTSLVGQISIAGSTASYLSVSDYRLKESVAPMTGALATVAQLKPVTYKWKADGSDGQGFIAHELQAVVPDCVTGDKDAVDNEGKPKYQGVDTSFLVATLTAALQESHQLIKDLQVRVAALEA
jgi:hypothetical protein